MSQDGADDAGPNPRGSVAARTLAVLEALADHARPVRAAQLVAELGGSRATVHRQIAVLHAAGWIERSDDGHYRIALRAARLAPAALRQAGLGERLAPALARLAERAQEVATLSVLADDHGRVAQQAAPTRTIQAGDGLGARLPLDSTAAGRVLAAFARPDLQAALRHRGIGLPADPELDRIVADGHARSDADGEAAAIAVPLLDLDGTCLAALAVVAPVERMDFDAALDHLHRTVAEIDGLGPAPSAPR